MPHEITVEQLEGGATTAFLQLEIALASGGEGVTESHLSALTASLSASDSMDSRVYFSPSKGKFLYLDPLHGPPLFAALFAFRRSLSCAPFADGMRDLLKKWVDGNTREVGLAMAVQGMHHQFRSCAKVIHVPIDRYRLNPIGQRQ